MNELEIADGRLLAALNQAWVSAARRAGAWLACRPGCIECCLGPFPINRLDAWRLQCGWQRLSAADPHRATALLTRARRAVEAMRRDFPGDPDSGLLEEDGPQHDAFYERYAAQACPALDPATGLCDLYEHRPLSCRTFGLPVRVRGQDLPPCRLCFRGAAAELIEACRIVVDPEEREATLLDGLGYGETLVAFALARLGGPPGTGG